MEDRSATTNKSESEKILDILRSIRNCPGTRITQIMFETCIPHDQLKEYLSMMIKNKLIIYIKEEKTFRINDYGMHILKLYDEIDKLLVYNLPDYNCDSR
jgi:predicted transcriptional regulator